MATINVANVSASTFDGFTTPLTTPITVTKWLSTLIAPPFSGGSAGSLASAIFNEGTKIEANAWITLPGGLVTVFDAAGASVTAAPPPANPSAATPTPTPSPTPSPPAAAGPSQSSPGNPSTHSNIESKSQVPNQAADPTLSATVSTTPTPAAPIGLQSSEGGKIAGAAIGCLIAGLLIGGLIAWFFLRKRGARGAQRAVPEYAPVQYDSSPEKQGAAVSTAPASSNHSGLGLEQFLLDSKPDSEIANEAVSRNELVQQHVESHYHLQNVQQDPNALAKTLAELEIGIQNGTGAFGPAHLANLALDPRTRYAALRHVISQAAFNASSVHHSGPISLLPNQVGSVVRGVPPVERHRGNAQAVDAAFTRWRQLSAFLLNPTRSERTPLVPTEDVSTQQAQYLTTILNQFTGVFASGDREQAYEQENHLREVIVECASLGYVLFSQPAEFRFNFTDKASRGKGLVAFPGLEKVRDESGMAYQSPITVTEPVVQR